MTKASSKPQAPVCNGVRMPRRLPLTDQQLRQRHDDAMNARIAESWAFDALTDECEPMAGWG